MSGCNSKIGAPKTATYAFGAAELRVGALNKVNQLDHTDSTGVLSDAGLTYTREFAELRGGAGNAVLARGVSGSDAKITATMPEQTFRNLQLAVGNGAGADGGSLTTTVTAAQVATDTSVTIATNGTGANAIGAGSVISIHKAGSPEVVQILVVASVAGTTLTLDPTTPLIYDINPLDIVALRNTVNGGQSCGEEYFTVELVAESVGGNPPTVIKGWYGTVTSGLEFSQNNQNFSETSLEISLYPVPQNLVAAGGAMVGASKLIERAPTFMMLPVA